MKANGDDLTEFYEGQTNWLDRVPAERATRGEDDHLEADYEDRQNGGIDVDPPEDDEEVEPIRRIRLRGDDIPPVSDYAHWNEDAKRIWYEENKYDMQYWDEPIYDGEDGY